MSNYVKESLVIDEGLRAYMIKVYNCLCAGLAVSAIACFAALNVSFIRDALFVVRSSGEVGLTGLGLLISIAPIALGLYFSFKQGTAEVEKLRFLFWSYAALMGMSSTTFVCLYYTAESIATTFFACAAMFGAMSIYGSTTARDLTSWGSFLIMGIYGLFAAAILSLFTGANPAFHFISSVVGVFLFTAMVAYDTQRLKSCYYYASGDREMEARMAVVGAFVLYLDIINLFLYMLRFFGKRRRD